ncbi:MAG: NAD(P)H-binding protein [Actinocrinis sp.]
MILVTGATGTVGAQVVRLLAAAGRPVSAVSRDAAAAMPDGVRLVHGDSSQPASIEAALDGVEAMLLAPRALGQGAADLLKLAAAHAVRRVVLISALSVEYGGGHRRFSDEFRTLEEQVKASGLRWTVLRCADFAANSLAWAPQILAAGRVRGAYGAAATAPLHELDLADVAVGALLSAEHVGRTYALTGPRSLTQFEKAQIIGEAIGEPVEFVDSPPGQVRQAMLAQGLPPDVPERLLGHLADCVERPGPVTKDVEQLLGRPALTFRRWADDHVAAFRGWNRHRLTTDRLTTGGPEAS